MKIAIHKEGGFNDGWKAYLESKKIPYKIVNAYDTSIVEQVADCDIFMWHHHHGDYRDTLFAKQLLFSLECSGKKVYPDFKTGWHFDDKLGQKYLFEAIGAPLVPSYAFYTKEDALKWISQATFPKVFKLRGGAGASNVKLAHTAKEAKRFVKKAFGRGFAQYDRLGGLKDRFNKWRQGNDSFVGVLKAFARCFVSTEFGRMRAPEKGYVYFQDFIPNNNTDTRIIVVGNKILGKRRAVRKGDFRASGSGILLHDAANIDVRCVKIAHEVSNKLGLQDGVFDFVHDENGNPLIVEISYGTNANQSKCEGYWDENYTFHKCTIDLPAMIIENVIKEMR